MGGSSLLWLRRMVVVWSLCLVVGVCGTDYTSSDRLVGDRLHPLRWGSPFAVHVGVVVLRVVLGWSNPHPHLNSLTLALILALILAPHGRSSWAQIFAACAEAG
jgi:hypothetical protein